MNRFRDLTCKEVVNVRDGCRFGYVHDIIVDICTAKVQYIVVPSDKKMFGFFGCDHEYIIAWRDIKQIGDDIILVDVCTHECLKECE